MPRVYHELMRLLLYCNSYSILISTIHQIFKDITFRSLHLYQVMEIYSRNFNFRYMIHSFTWPEYIAENTVETIRFLLASVFALILRCLRKANDFPSENRLTGCEFLCTCHGTTGCQQSLNCTHHRVLHHFYLLVIVSWTWFRIKNCFIIIIIQQMASFHFKQANEYKHVNFFPYCGVMILCMNH